MAHRVSPPQPIVYYEQISLWWAWQCPECRQRSLHAWATRYEARTEGHKHLRRCQTRQNTWGLSGRQSLLDGQIEANQGT